MATSITSRPGEVSTTETPAASLSDLAVVVVNYNAGEYLARCVRSVVKTSGGLAIDLLVIDNASRDGSTRVAAQLTPQVSLIENPNNRGLSPAWNQGVRLVNARWILFLNPDVEVSQGDLTAFVKAGDNRPDVALLGPVIRNPDGTIYESGRAFPGVVQAVGHVFLGPFSYLAIDSLARIARQAGTGVASARSIGSVVPPC